MQVLWPLLLVFAFAEAGKQLSDLLAKMKHQEVVSLTDRSFEQFISQR